MAVRASNKKLMQIIPSLGFNYTKSWGNAIPVQVLSIPGGSGSQLSRQLANEGGYVVNPTHWLPLAPRKYPWCSFLLESESTPGPCVAGRIMSIKNPNDTIGNRTRYLLACNTVPQPNAPLRAPFKYVNKLQFHNASVTVSLKFHILDTLTLIWEATASWV